MLSNAEKMVFPLRHQSFKSQCLASTESFCAVLYNAITEKASPDWLTKKPRGVSVYLWIYKAALVLTKLNFLGFSPFTCRRTIKEPFNPSTKNMN